MWLVVVRDGWAYVKPGVRLDELSSRNLGDGAAGAGALSQRR